MGKHFDRRPFTQYAFEQGRQQTTRLSGSRAIMDNIRIVVAGKINASVAGTAQPFGGAIAALIQNIRLRVSGYEVALGERVGPEDRINAPGWAFLYNGSTTGNYQNGIPYANRINLLNLGLPIVADGESIIDIDVTSTGEQNFRAVFTIPFYNLRALYGIGARDPHLDMSFLPTVELQLTMGTVADLTLTGTQAMTAVISDATVSIKTAELQLDDRPTTGAGNTETPECYFRTYLENIAVGATNSRLRKPLNTNGNYYRQSFIGLDNDGKPSDAVIKNMILEQYNDNILDMDALEIRDKNKEDYPLLLQQDSSYRNVSIFKDSGLYVIEPSSSAYGSSLTQTQNFGPSNESAAIILDVAKPAGGDGVISILTTEMVPGVRLKAATYREQDMTQAVATVAAPLIAARNEQATAIQAGAQRSGVSST